MNPLLDVPLNITRVFVRGITHSGCEVWMPVAFDNEQYQKHRQSLLQQYLNTQSKPPLPNPPEPKRFA